MVADNGLEPFFRTYETPMSTCPSAKDTLTQGNTFSNFFSEFFSGFLKIYIGGLVL